MCYIKYEQRGWSGIRSNKWIKSKLTIPSAESKQPLRIQRNTSGFRFRSNFFLPYIQKEKITKDTEIKIPLLLGNNKDQRTAVITDVRLFCNGNQFIIYGFKYCEENENPAERDDIKPLIHIKFSTSTFFWNNEAIVTDFLQQWKQAGKEIAYDKKIATYPQRVRAFYKLLYLKEATYNSMLIFENLLEIFVSVHHIFSCDLSLKNQFDDVHTKSNRVLGSLIMFNTLSVNTRAFKTKKKKFREATNSKERDANIVEIDQSLDKMKARDRHILDHIEVTILFLENIYKETNTNVVVNKTYRKSDFANRLILLLNVYHLILDNTEIETIYSSWNDTYSSIKHPTSFVESAYQELNKNPETFDDFLKYFMSSYIIDCFDTVTIFITDMISTEFNKLKKNIQEKTTTINQHVPKEILQRLVAELNAHRLRISNDASAYYHPATNSTHQQTSQPSASVTHVTQPPS